MRGNLEPALELLTYWQDPTNTLDGLALIEAEQRNREINVRQSKR